MGGTEDGPARTLELALCRPPRQALWAGVVLGLLCKDLSWVFQVLAGSRSAVPGQCGSFRSGLVLSREQTRSPGYAKSSGWVDPPDY